MLEVAGSFLCQSMEDAQVPLRRLADPTTKVLVYDSETSGLDPRECKIVGHVLTFGPDPASTYYVPVRHGEPFCGNISADHADKHYGHPFEVELDRLLRRPDLRSVGHNLDFDLRFLYNHGIDPLGQFEDTMVNQAILNEFTTSFSLDECCRQHKVQAKKGDALYRHLAERFGGEPNRNQMANFWKLPGDDPIAVEYACGDGVSTWQLWEAQCEELEAQNLTGIRLLESRVTRTLYRMFKRGVLIDQDRLEQVETEARKRLKVAAQALPEGLNVRSSTQIKKLMESHGISGWPTTPLGNPQFNEAWLSTFDLGKAIVAVRKYAHLLSSFIEPMKERHLWPDGRVRPRYYQMASDDFGTVTGRFSCTDPNLQQVPKRNYETGKLFRSIFIPSPGSRWLSADLSQCEPRILAHYSNAKVLVDGFMSVPFVDAHSSVTIAAGLEEMLGIPFKQAREYGKRLNQTLITGGGRAKIIGMLGERGAEIYDAFFENLPEVRILQKQASRRMEARGYILSLLGRRARLQKRDKSYLAINRLLQVGNADIIKDSLTRMDAYFEAEGDQVGILNTVHDSTDLDVPEGLEDQAIVGLREMCAYGPGRRVHMRVPMAAEWAIGANWSDATYDAEKFMLGEDPNDTSYLVAAAAA